MPPIARDSGLEALVLPHSDPTTRAGRVRASHRPLRSVLRALAVLGVLALPAAASAAPRAGAEGEADAAAHAAASVVTVVTRDVSGNALGTGLGFFIDIGRLVVPRALLLDRAYSAAILYGGREQRVTAVLADDDRAGLMLVAVNLPDGAPPAVKTRSARAAVRAGRYHALAADGSVTTVTVSGERDVLGFGPVCGVTGAGTTASGTPVVDDDAEMVGVLMNRSARDAHLVFLLPTARVLRLAPVPVLSLAEWLRRPQRARSEEAEAAFLEGVRAMLEDRADEAADHFRNATAAVPADADAQAALAASELAAGHRDAAVAAYRAAIAADPANPRFHHDLGLVFSDAGRWEEAAGEFAQVARLRPMDAEAHFNLGSAYGQIGRLEDEYLAYQAALRENSAHVKALRNLGIVCIGLKRYAEAVAVSARAIRLVPTDAQLHAQLGVAYFDLQNYSSAIDELKKAVELEPGFVKAHYGLALVYVASGQRTAALTECDTLKRLDPARGAEVLKMVSGR